MSDEEMKAAAVCHSLIAFQSMRDALNVRSQERGRAHPLPVFLEVMKGIQDGRIILSGRNEGRNFMYYMFSTPDKCNRLTITTELREMRGRRRIMPVITCEERRADGYASGLRIFQKSDTIGLMNHVLSWVRRQTA